MKNIQIIDGAINSIFEIYSVPTQNLRFRQVSDKCQSSLLTLLALTFPHFTTKSSDVHITLSGPAEWISISEPEI